MLPLHAIALCAHNIYSLVNHDGPPTLSIFAIYESCLNEVPVLEDKLLIYL